MFGIMDTAKRIATALETADSEREIKRLRNALAQISLMEYESTSSASDKVHAAARIARTALYPKKEGIDA
jgi:hypothetical protein